MKSTLKHLKKLVFLGFMCISNVTLAQYFCNPINISYRFSIENPLRRETADPTMVLHKDTFYLFASRSGGYWYSVDMFDWKFITYKGLTDASIENYAPTAATIGDWVYFRANGDSYTYRSKNPSNGIWEIVTKVFPITEWDPAIFVDDDARVYYYYGCSNATPLKVIELDPTKSYLTKGTASATLGGKPIEHGWERTGDYNTLPASPWIEGSWMNKINGKYYLQYAGPGTEFKAYSDGLYIGENPMGPFTLAENNPFSSKPEGFLAGAGHGSTYLDKYGNYWHIATMSISVKHIFERRLGIFPVDLHSDGMINAYTAFGDYPKKKPKGKFNSAKELDTDWMLLTLNKKVEVSSANDTFPANLASDENIRTYWSAKTADKGEWLLVDLDTICSINAVQVNLAEHNAKRDTILISPRRVNYQIAPQFLVEYSTDKTNWKTLFDKTNNQEDLTHQFFTLDTAVNAKYIKVTNYRMPSGTFAISDLRVFGKGKLGKPSKVKGLKAVRESIDKRSVKLSWEKASKATGYMIYYGHDLKKLYHSYQVYKDTSVTINTLSIDQNYWYRIDAFGEDGITVGDTTETTFIQHSVIEAEYYAGMLGIKAEACAEGGKDVYDIAEGDYIYFDVIDFGNITNLDLRVSSSAKTDVEAGTIEIRANSSDGTLLGTAKVMGTGNSQIWQTITTDIAGASKVDKLYLVFKGKEYSINWIEAKGLKVTVKQAQIESKYRLVFGNNSNQLIIQGLQAEATVEIWNTSGQRTITTRTTGTVDISSLSTGVYIIQIGNEKPLKFIKTL